jgi:hypothetical protein
MPPNIRDVGASPFINMLIHADIGTGKTSLIGSGGKEFKTLLIRSPIDHADPIIGSGVKELIVKNWEDIFEALEYLRHEGHEWDWVWWDSVSLTQDIGLDDVYEGVLDQKGGRSGARARFGPDRGEYRVNMWRLEQFVRHTVGSGGFNFGITAHSFWYTDPESDTPTSQLMPWIQGKAMPQKICGMMNIVGYMEVKQRTVRGEEKLARIIHFNKTDRWYAKCQFKLPTGEPVFGDSGTVVNPTMPKLMEAIQKSRVRRGRRTRRER